jgi:predicted outer membrane repeat protein
VYTGGKLNVEFSTYVMSFSNTVYGGAMYIYLNGDRSSMTFTNSYVVFSSNSATNYGGGLAFYGNAGDTYTGGLVIRRSIVNFIGNVAGQGGGAITVFGGNAATKEFTIEDSVVNFSSNGVSGAGSSNGGGALSFFFPTRFTASGSTIIFSANWINPSATNAKGLSIYQNGTDGNNNYVITANYKYSDVEFSNHNYTPDSNKAIIYVTGTNVMLTFGVLGDNGTAGTVRFTSNTSISYGRMWWGSAVDSVNFYAVRIVARFNSATGTGNGNGGGFFYTGQGATNNNYNVNIGGVDIPSNFLFRRGADISSNTSASDGGAIL